jgi:hypothetical protein
MKRFLRSVATVALGLAVAGGAQAAGKGSSHSSSSRSSSHYGPSTSVSYNSQGTRGSTYWSPGRSGNYYSTYARRSEHGYYYPGRNHYHWSYNCWDRRYGCRLYFDPGLCCYFYFCVPDDCYYPVTYCPYRVYSWNTPAYSAAPVAASASATAVASASAGTAGPPPAPPAPYVGGN